MTIPSPLNPQPPSRLDAALALNAELLAAKPRGKTPPPRSRSSSSTSTPREPRLLWASEALALSTPKWLLPGMLRRGELVVLVGEPSSGKSTLATDFAFRVATGGTVCFEGCGQGLVLYVAAEGAQAASMRVRANLEHARLTRAPLAILPGPINLVEFRSVAMLIGAAKEASEKCGEAPALIVLDNFARCIASPNAAALTAAALRACDKLRVETGASVLLTENANAPSVPELSEAADTVLRLDGTRLVAGKQRSGPTFGAWTIGYVPARNGGRVVTLDTDFTRCR